MKFSDHQGLIGQLSAVSIAAACDTLPVNVRAWGARNRIPAEYWPSVIALAASQDLAIDANWLMQTSPPRKKECAAKAAPAESIAA